ncbi:B12-binding domain-containing radical SAM protein [Hyalangium versicolor]|uniref:B12-binding domain-containing radical SAM protein n=1 Tax=Hyalangium versicolor TaxID=2861190 RepID=UPI001CCB3076|nr:radical SAM protein [Hyalangium versicolor]
MEARTIVLIKAVTGGSKTDEYTEDFDAYSEDFDEVKLGESLALGYLKAFLESQGRPWKVVVINPLIGTLSAEAVAALTDEHQPFLVGISLVYQWHRNFAFKLARLIKERLPRTHIVLGGLYTSSDWKGLLERGAGRFDSICRGEGEQTFLELADVLAAGREWRGLHGLAYLDQGTPVFHRRRRRIEELERLPFPDRDQLPGILGKGGVIQLEASRGCNAGCTFCDVRHTGWIGRPPNHLVDELEQLAARHPDHEVWFIDNIFIGFRADRFERAEKIADEIIRRGIRVRFSLQDRADNVERGVFLKLKAAGLNRVYIGIESFSESALRRWQKGTSAVTNKKALHTLKELGILTQFGFLVFDGGTTLQEVRENIEGLREVAADNAYLHMHNFNELIPYAGTQLEQEYIQEYGHAPDKNSRTPWRFPDARVRVFRDWAWKYLFHLWPVSEFVFHNFDDQLLQPDFPAILPAKNRCFVEYLESLYERVSEERPEQELWELCRSAVVATKEALGSSLRQWANSETRARAAEAIGSISEKVTLPD